MFGLMRNTSCLQAGQPDWYRLHYCGTCKSLARIYGQRSRLFLNYDIVFLAEVLSLLQEANTAQWDPKLYSKNCFDLPKTKDIPTSLQFAADINTILVELKINDNMADDLNHVWKWAKTILHKPFSKIQDRMDQWGIDRQTLVDFQEDDLIRQEKNISNNTISEDLSYYAEPTANITAYLFSKGANAIQQSKYEDLIFQIGFSFGELIYALDAWKDFEKDEEEENFNPLFLSSIPSVETKKQQAADWILEKSQQIQDIIQSMEIDANVKESIQVRLQMNLASTLDKGTHFCTPKSGIEQSTVPSFIRGFTKTTQQISTWFNPLKPSRFVISYLVILLLFFQQKLSAAAAVFRHPDNWESNNLVLLVGLVAIPISLFFVGNEVYKNRERINKKIARKQKRLLRKMRRAKIKFKKDGKLKWWAWALIIGGGLILLSALLSGGNSGASGGSCGSPDCGGCGGCGDCGDCGGGCEPSCG